MGEVLGGGGAAEPQEGCQGWGELLSYGWGVGGGCIPQGVLLSHGGVSARRKRGCCAPGPSARRRLRTCWPTTNGSSSGTSPRWGWGGRGAHGAPRAHRRGGGQRDRAGLQPVPITVVVGAAPHPTPLLCPDLPAADGGGQTPGPQIHLPRNGNGGGGRGAAPQTPPSFQPRLCRGGTHTLCSPRWWRC